MTGVHIRDLTRRFGSVEAVRGISLEIHEGETFGLLGPNGAGKTTTLSMLSTLLPPNGGDVKVFGHSLARDVEQVRREVGLVPQDVALYPDLTAEENLTFFGRLHGMGARRLRARTDELLSLVGLSSRKGDRVRTYSGGMQRRLNLACSLVHEPRLLLLDEPTVGVDPQSRENLFAAIQAIAASGTTVVYTTHYMEEAERLCDRIAIMDAGRVVAAGTLRELLEIIGMGEVVEIRGVAVEPLKEALRALPDVVKIEAEADRVRVFVKNAARALGDVAAILENANGEIGQVEVYPVNLERVFMHLTGRALRD